MKIFTVYISLKKYEKKSKLNLVSSWNFKVPISLRTSLSDTVIGKDIGLGPGTIISNFYSKGNDENPRHFNLVWECTPVPAP